MTSAESAHFEADIIEICAAHRQTHRKDGDYRACVLFESTTNLAHEKYFIKFDSPDALRPEFLTQSYIYSIATSHRSGGGGGAPRIPQALHYFEAENQAFLVMEHIELSNPLLITDLAEKTAEALHWLSQVPPPPEDDIDPTSKHMIGPVGGGLIRHSFFKNHTAPLHFSSVDALERYMNRVRRCPHFFKFLHSI